MTVKLSFQKKLYAAKNKELILEGVQNPNDSLWDIHVYKTDIIPDNYIFPATKTALYPSALIRHTANKIK